MGPVWNHMTEIWDAVENIWDAVTNFFGRGAVYSKVCFPKTKFIGLIKNVS